jgi:ABC-type nitrate/sulfonate/bicarbonate transport system substrate-binding protein
LGAAIAGPQHASAADKMIFAVPAVPPVYGGVVAYVAKETGIFAKYDIDADVRAMDSGAAAASAVNAGSVDFSMSPTPFVATMISNAGAPVIGIWGMERGDWLIASMDGSKTSCESMKGQGVGVDSPRGARWIQLNIFLINKCKLETDKDVPTVPLSSNVGTAMASGQINFGVLHIDDVPVIARSSGKKVHIVAVIEDVAPGQHYLIGTVRKDNLAKKRDAFVRLVASLRDSVAYMRNPANEDRVATIAGVTKREKPDALAALREYNKMEFWPNNRSGLAKEPIERAIRAQVAAGKATEGKSGIKPDKTAVAYDQFVDLTIWRDAEKLKK